MTASQNADAVGIAGGASTEYRISAHARPGRGAAVRAADTQIKLDAGWGQEPSGLPGPAQLLAAALAACLLKNLARAGDLLGFQYDDAHVEVVARRQDSPPKFVEITYTLRVTTDEPPRRVELTHANLRKFGTVYNTLATACEIHGTMQAVAGTSDSEPG
ncbi:MAG TPA: OsmC family protein [Jiangellaceae bacterium]